MILVDLNVVLDVVQERVPHYGASAAVIHEVVQQRGSGLLPAHALTTVHYIVGRYQNTATADQAVDWLLRYFDVATIGREELLRARALGWADFEDAVVAVAAESRHCEAIVTRNVRDFRGSVVPALAPEEFLLGLDARGKP